LDCVAPSLVPVHTWSTAPLWFFAIDQTVFGEGEQESEVFLNINTEARKVRFSMKDEDSRDLVPAELSKVL
jgi:hypothetical protein